MKYLLIILCALSFSSTGLAQVIESDSSLTTKSIHQSSLKGINGNYGHYNWKVNTSDWFLIRTTYEEYDANANLTVICTLKNNLCVDETRYTYNANNLVTSTLHKYSFSLQSDLVNNYFETIEYNSNNDITSIVLQTWDYRLNKWNDSTRKTIYYDSNFLELETVFEVSINGEWKVNRNFKQNRSYENNLLKSNYTVLTDYKPLVGGNIEIDTIAKILYYYNANNLLSTKEYYKRNYNNPTKWATSEKFDYDYTNNIATRITYQMGSGADTIWKPWYMYDSIEWKNWSGTVEGFYSSDFRKYIWKTWKTAENQYVNTEKTSIEDIYPDLSYVRTNFKWNNTNWDTAFVTTYLYDEQKNNVLMQMYRYAAGTKSMYIGSRFLYTYAGQNKITDYIFQTYSSSVGNYVNVERKKLLVATSIAHELKNDAINIYPNPSQTTFIIDILKPLEKNSTLKVYDLHAKLIQEHTLEKNTTRFELKNLAEGMYFIQYEGTSFKIIKY